jgi:geranylgeranyl reductase family protein
VVGAGPAGSAAALSLLQAAPELNVALLDAAEFPRDKTCGDGIAPQVVDRLARLGLPDVVDGWAPIRAFDVRHEDWSVSRSLRRPMWVVPRRVFDARLQAAAIAAGATFVRQRVRNVHPTAEGVLLDDNVRAQVVIGADGAHSVARKTVLPAAPGRRALALRGYAPIPDGQEGVQRIVFSGRRHPSYAWSFDRGDGLVNVGYGELLDPHGQPPSRSQLMERLDRLLPGVSTTGSGWRGHHLPLSSWRWSHPDGRVLLAGDAAGLVNPVTGEGIYYAVTTGMLAGAAAASALGAGDPQEAGRGYRRAARALLGGHLRHVAVAARVFGRTSLMDAGIRAAARSQRVFDDLMDVALAQGKLTPAVLRELARSALRYRELPAS